MAKRKDSATSEAKRTTKSAGRKTPGSRPLQSRRTSAKTAPDAPRNPAATGAASGATAAPLSAEELYKMIQESAYFKAKARGFAPGHEVQDWIEAEAEVRRRLAAG